ncbi:MAG: hypothetical protein FJX25_14480 [Alphaproteobacteria bacterium]|nr:hypothetical protein [Alphaproteobacteria bacterium]
MFELQACVARQWTPQIGDPALTGWLTVASYGAAALLSIAVWRQMKHQRGRAFWGILIAVLVFLALNKQLDLQSALTAAGRCLSRTQGWYDNRRMVQEAFIGTLLGVLVLGMIVAMLALRGSLGRNLPALLGLVVVLGFVMVRAASFHQFDHLIGARSLGVSNNFLFENAGLLLISLNAVLHLRRQARPQRMHRA